MILSEAQKGKEVALSPIFFETFPERRQQPGKSEMKGVNYFILPLF